MYDFRNFMILKCLLIWDGICSRSSSRLRPIYIAQTKTNSTLRLEALRKTHSNRMENASQTCLRFSLDGYESVMVRRLGVPYNDSCTSHLYKRTLHRPQKYDGFKPLTFVYSALNDLSVRTSTDTHLPPFQNSRVQSNCTKCHYSD